ncbi:MAG: DNA double-strand break repair nuclease NurA [Aquificaceae bacterium]
MNKYRITLRPWELQDIEALEYEESEQFVDTVEELKPHDGLLPKESISIVFVDGVRRTEYALYLIDEMGSSYEGAFASLGAGAVLIRLGRINMIEESMFNPIVRRYAVIKGFLDTDPFKEIGFGVRFVDGDVSKEINRIMKEELEVSVARRVLKELKSTLVLCDGTLSYRLKDSTCLGYIKTIKKLYMRREDTHILNELKCGQRSPLIRIHHQHKQEEKEKVEKYTWYIKLIDGEGMGSFARIEVFERVGLDTARRLADLTAGILPSFGSMSFQDRRSPQNLLPIKSLENFLRKHLGSYSLVRREIEKFIYA